jgi:CRP/FNR family transcriptional regulator, cyclic AMP receptor protein
VEEGLLQSTLLRPDGDHLIVERIGPGAICGEGPCLHGLPPLVEIVAVEPSEVVVFGRALMMELFARDPEFGRCIAEVVSFKYNRLLSRLGAATDRRPGDRVMELFARLAAGSARHPRGRVVRTRLTHQDIAAMTGLSRVTVTRTLAGLRTAGALELVAGGYLLVDADGPAAS